MQIIFYQIFDAPNVVHKNLIGGLTMDGTLREPVDYYSPEVTIHANMISNLEGFNFNYMYIPRFKKYYYVNGYEVLNGNLFRIKDVKEDVLMSLKSAFELVDCIVDKSASDVIGDEYINDGSFISSVKTIDQVFNYPNGFNDRPDYILMVAGGVK